MKFTLIALAAVCAVAFASPVQNDKTYLERQKEILRLFKYINQRSYYKDFVDVAANFNINAHSEDYTKPDVAHNYTKLYDNGLLQRGQIFSVFYEAHLKEAIALYKLFYYAKDFQTFYKTAVWARQNVNEGLFLYTVSVAIVHRPDTYKFVLPPIYEIYPHYFFSTEVIHHAHRYKQQYFKGEQQDKNHPHTYTINANYSGYYLNLHPEQSLSYFTEDVGINAYYYYYHISYPFWLGGQDFDYQDARRGEVFYYVYQQFLARYYLERLSNGFGEIPFFNYEAPVATGYCPSLTYPNGLEFPSRPNHANLYEYFYNYGQKYGNNKYAYSYTYVQDYERRIRNAIDKGYVNSRAGEKIQLDTPKALNILGNLIDSNPDSPDNHFYGALQIYARHLLGYSSQALNKYQVAPSALEHYETASRDPAFYQIYKHILLFFQRYQAHLPAYTKKQLHFKGVKVTNVQFDRLVTYFDNFYADLSNAVYVNSDEFQEQNVHVRAHQQRLNHKNFTYHINVKSDKKQDAVVRVYYGPKYDEYGRHLNISQNRLNFVQFDHFKYQLEVGENVIERNSQQTYFYQNDRTSYNKLYQQVTKALNGNGQFKTTPKVFGFPRRFLIPKGTHGGFKYQFYVVVSPYVAPSGKQQDEEEQHSYPYVGSNALFVDGYSLGYPFDRPIHYEQYFNNIPNFYIYNATVYHKHVNEINASTAHQ